MVGLRVGHQFGHGLVGQVLVDHQHVGVAQHRRDGGEVACRVEGHLFVDVRADRDRRAGREEQHRAVGRRLDRHLARQGAARPRSVLDQYLRAQRGRQRRREQPCRTVDRAAGRVAHHQPHGRRWTRIGYCHYATQVIGNQVVQCPII